MNPQRNITPGNRFRRAMENENPLQLVGTVNAYCALMAENAGFKAIYLSGAGVANASFGMPDLGMTTMNDVAEDVRRITSITHLPLFVDVDTGWGHTFCIARATRMMIAAGAAGMHMEDQEIAKRCGHRPGKAIVDTIEMCDRIKSAVDARHDESFVIMARTDALAVEPLDAVIDRCHSYIETGADMIFAEAVTDPAQYQRIAKELSVPVLANMTEYGQSPLLSAQQLGKLGIQLVLYPLSAFRAMNAAAESVYRSIRLDGTQTREIEKMQTRERLYEILNYHSYEQTIDRILEKAKS
jgi:methylisocitrate lyase